MKKANKTIRREKIAVINAWMNKFPCKNYFKYQDGGCIHDRINAREIYNFIEAKFR